MVGETGMAEGFLDRSMAIYVVSVQVAGCRSGRLKGGLLRVKHRVWCSGQWTREATWDPLICSYLQSVMTRTARQDPATRSEGAGMGPPK